MNDVLIIIPTYNEIENIDKIIRSIFNLYSDVHILVVDDNSPDQTSSKVIELQTIFKEQLHLQIRKSKYCQITTIEYINFRIVPPRKPINEPNAILNDFNKSKSDSIIAPI